MLDIHKPTESELVEQARTTLARRQRSLQTCHRPAHPKRSKVEPPRESGAYVPELSARLDDDRNLTDGARRCARKIAELTYRSNRAGRSLEVTVTYLMKALGRCRRTVQRYLRQLEEAGYIDTDVIAGARSRMCVGLVVTLLGPVFARHHRQRWPERREVPGATQESQNQRFIDSLRGKQHRYSRHDWAEKCMDGVFRSLMKTLPPFNPAIPTKR